MSAAGGECWAYTVDLCDRHSIYKVAARVKEEVGKVSRRGQGVGMGVEWRVVEERGGNGEGR